ncbi:MAG: gliding motility lipoprotein GldH [Bacteroidales bacterium]|nr:gliding motility lipoprotein GldH [Bacteroidales bacterium]
MKLSFQKLSPLILLTVILGCGGNDQNKKAIINEFVHLPSKGWRYDDVKKFSFSITDTARQYDLTINVRNDKRYAYSNLWLYVRLTSPIGEILTDRTEIVLADELGNWLGKVEGRSLHEISHTYKKAFQFLHLGIYTLELQHAMRDSSLSEITDIGLSVVPVN